MNVDSKPWAAHTDVWKPSIGPHAVHQPATSLRNCQGHLDAALRCGNAACEAVAAADRLSVRLNRPREGDSGWDILSLQYAVEGPLAAVLTPGALASYQRLFRLLFSIRRVERTLGGAWARLGDVAHALARLRALEREHGTDVPGTELVGGWGRRAVCAGCEQSGGGGWAAVDV
jgi:Gamma tubulin complex component C-terminal